MTQNAAFIGHIFHERTASSSFFKEIISEFYNVDAYHYDPADPNKFDYLSLMSKKYECVFFWQTEVLASRLYGKLSGRKIIIPMYDAAIYHDLEFWRAFPSVLFISFSDSLHEMLQSARCNSVRVQFFPEVSERQWSREDPLSGFFWERRPGAAYDGRAIIAASAALGLERLHIHLPADFETNADARRDELLSIAEEADSNLTLSFSDWFPERADMLKEANSHAFYFAPRRVEGIGMSFLEAMAAGQIIVGANEPTLNEYIVDGETGFLLGENLTFPHLPALDADKIAAMSDLALTRAAAGRAQWLQDRDRLRAIIRRGHVRGDADRGASFERAIRAAAGARV